MIVHLLGVPMDLGSGRRGVDMGPSAIRIAGVADRLTELGRPLPRATFTACHWQPCWASVPVS
jgi:arginase